MIRLVVNAEEFGATGVGDQHIVRAHLEGIVTSTSLLGNCRDLAEASASLHSAPQLGVGLSFALIGGTPVAAPQTVPSLVTVGGALRTNPGEFAIDWLKDAIAPDDVEREMEAQLGRALAAGLPLDHLNTRGHVGFLPGIGQMVERLARRHKIAGMRSTVESPTLSWLTDPRRGLRTGVLSGLSWLTRRRLGPLRHGPRSWGYLESGRLDEVRIMEIIGRLAPGAHELICHPGATESDDRRNGGDGVAERRALTSTKVKTALERRGIVLCRWQEVF